ncbi:MAG TPA: gamma carbonic anhydrase family protein [Elusimicrobia bacterium]|nr:gamma carbonic anhydrase family protein [Elusimicrobiota bacterium]
MRVVASPSLRSGSVHPTAFIAPSADVLGDVRLGEWSSVWYQTVLRADMEPITVGARSNIQDLTMVHVDEGVPCTIGADVTVGHRAILHGCRIGDRTLIGMGAIVMEATVGSRVIIGAGALVAAGARIPSGVLALGVPAKVVRKLRPEELRLLAASAREYRALARRHARTSRVLFGR